MVEIKNTFKEKTKKMLNAMDRVVKGEVAGITKDEFDFATYKRYRDDYNVPPKELLKIAVNEFGYKGGQSDFNKLTEQYKKEE